MASQQTLIAETIRGMKLAIKRRASDGESHVLRCTTEHTLTSAQVDYESDSSVRWHTNRGNKMKKRARLVREGRLDTSGGQSYKKVGGCGREGDSLAQSD